ncbi:MAG: arsenate reductase ArsC [Methanoregula sp.]|nr:arsenate reductase ArsC [Methanoregula sp.]
MRKETVIFICSYNSVRSPLAEGLLKKRSGDRYQVCSAGVVPIRLNPLAIRVMEEIGVDISRHDPVLVCQFRDQYFDYVVTLCDQARMIAGGRLPQGHRILHRNFVTPSEVGEDRDDVIAAFRNLRDEIGDWLAEIFPEIH